MFDIALVVDIGLDVRYRVLAFDIVIVHPTAHPDSFILSTQQQSAFWFMRRSYGIYPTAVHLQSQDNCNGVLGMRD